MKKFLLFCLYFFIAIAIMGCSSEQNKEQKYYVLIVQGKTNISGKFGKFASNDYSVIETEYLTSIERAKEKYPKYEIDKAPSVLIFETNGGEMKKLKLKTYDVDEAIEFLEEKK